MEYPPLKLTAASLNGLLLISVVILSILNYQQGNKRRSWASAFQVLCVVWLCFRQIFWYLTLVSHGPWSASQFYLIYWFPHPIQFAMYFLVPLFYAKVLCELGRFEGWIGKGHEMRRKFVFIRNTYIVCVILMVLFMVGCVVTAGSLDKQQYRCLISNHNWKIARKRGMTIADDADDDGMLGEQKCYEIALSTAPVRWLSAISFIVLALVLLGYGYQIGNLTDSEANRFFISDPQHLGRINVVLFFIFITRGIYEIFILKGLLTLPGLALNADSDLDGTSFVCMLCWDYLPLFILMGMVSTPSGSGSIQLTPSIVSSRSYVIVSSQENLGGRGGGITPNSKSLTPSSRNTSIKSRVDDQGRSLSTGAITGSYGSIPKPSSFPNWQSRCQESEVSSRIMGGSADSLIDGRTVTPWSLLAGKPSDEAVNQQALEWRVKDGWSPSSSFDRVPIRDVAPSYNNPIHYFQGPLNSSALSELVETQPNITHMEPSMEESDEEALSQRDEDP